MSRAHLKQNTEFSHLYQKDISTIGYKGANYPPITPIIQYSFLNTLLLHYQRTSQKTKNINGINQQEIFMQQYT